MAKISLLEQETIITFNELEKNAVCYTANRKLTQKLEEMRTKSPSVQLVREDEYGRTYTFPKKWIKVKMPREISGEERQKLIERAKRNFGKDTKGDDTASV